MVISRDRYLQQLLDRRENGLIKVVCGLRRCGKSFLLFRLFRERLLGEGIPEERIVTLALDSEENRVYRSPEALWDYLRGRITDSKEVFYVLLDEIQYAISREELRHPSEDVRLYGVLNGLLQLGNVDIYVTGSNSKRLSKDVMTAFRGRGDVVEVNPLSFAEYHSAVGGERAEAFEEYCRYGGMPLVLSQRDDQAKQRYLSRLFEEVYFRDILERYDFLLPHVLSELTDSLCSSIGSLTNVSKIVNTLASVQKLKVTHATIASYLEALKDSFLFRGAQRYDVKGRKYFESPLKFYCTDVGLRNARLNFRQQEETHLLENIVFNELHSRGFAVDVGVMHLEDAERKMVRTEIDFVANAGSRRYYVQAALRMDDEEKRKQELRPLLAVNDHFRKMVITKTLQSPWYDEKGILHLGVYDFLLDPQAMDY